MMSIDPIAAQKIKESNYDFFDFGASKGGSIEFAKKKLRGSRGLGFDLNQKKVDIANAAGLECMRADVTDLQLPEDCTRFVMISHFLEHLPSFDVVRKSVMTATKVAREFVYIQGPYYDSDAYLAKKGFKFFWSDWKAHSFHLTALHLKEMLAHLDPKDVFIAFYQPIYGSYHPTLHPLSSPRNQFDYSPALHPPKAARIFWRPVFREVLCVIRTGPCQDWERLKRARGTVYSLEEIAGKKFRMKWVFLAMWNFLKRPR